jgi:hypothetical protein
LSPLAYALGAEGRIGASKERLMFEALIEQARDMIQRLHASAEQGRDAVPELVKVRYSELEAWDAATQGIVTIVFGADTAELPVWQALIERRGALVGEAMQKDIKRGEYFGLIDYFHLAIGLLLEFEAKYQYQLASPYLDSLRAAAGLTDQLAPLDQAHLASPADDRRELTIWVSRETYHWLNQVAVSRELGRANQGNAAEQLAATIIERVALKTRQTKTQ